MSTHLHTVTRLAGLLLAGTGLLAAATAQASTVNATILADNGSIAVLEVGGNYAVIPASVSGNWPTPKTFAFTVPDDARSMATCRIHVIAWGDGSVAQGMMAHFAGTGGIAFTGQPGGPFNVRMSSVTHGGSTATGLAFANNNANAAAIINGAPGTGSNGFVSQPAVSGGIPGTWGPVALPDVQGRGQVAFLWDNRDTMANPRNYRVISTPCDRVARVVEPVAHTNSWEIAGQFNPTNSISTATNPFEVWTYGYTVAADCSGPVIPFRNKGQSPNSAGRPTSFWSRGSNGANNTADLPMVGQSEVSTQLTPLRYSPQGLWMHPGSRGECAIVRFTAPEAGTYRMMGRFWAQNVTAGGTNVSTSVVKNGTITVDAAMTITAPGTPTNNPFNWSGTLAQGDTVDFRVGANGSFLNDSTGLHGYIERVTP
jgi:hypothetical protein